MSVYKIEDMSCAHCVAAIEKTVKAVDGQAVVSADLAAKTVRIESGAGPEAIVAALDEAGYEATPLPI